MVRYGLVSGVIRYGFVCGLVWSSMVWYGPVWSGVFVRYSPIWSAVFVILRLVPGDSGLIRPVPVLFIVVQVYLRWSAVAPRGPFL